MSENTNYTIAEDFELPSQGKIYDVALDPHVRLRSMTVRDEMKRQSQTNAPHRTLCEIIDTCLVTKLPIRCYDLCIGDYEYLLHKLRVVSYGPDYKMVVGCPHCTSVYEETINLDDLKVKEVDFNELENNLKFTLPASKKEIKIKLQTAHILDSIDLKVKDLKKKNTGDSFDPTMLVTLQETIDTVDGIKLSYVELENFINNLSARDGNYIMNKIEKANRMIGLDTSLDVTCKTCGGDIKTFFRFGPEFFRPEED